MGEKAAELIQPKLPRVSKLEYFFSKRVGQAIAAYKMIEDNDKILVGISGGKDSMSLLKVLRYKQKKLPIHFDIIACYVNLGLDDNRRIVLEDYLKVNNYRYTIEEAKLWQTKNKKDDSINPALSMQSEIKSRKGGINCFWCAFNRRKRLFQTAQKFGCNKVALGYHKDDIAETFLMNLFFHGEISTMVPNQPFFSGKFRIIRPLTLCEEKFVIRYAKASNFPEFNTKCPNADTQKTYVYEGSPCAGIRV